MNTSQGRQHPVKSQIDLSHWLLLLSVGIVVIYLTSYIMLSMQGKYAAAVWGMSQSGFRPKYYAWAPRGFYDPSVGRWKSLPRILYFPLYWLDERYWHNQGHRLLPSDPCHPEVHPSNAYERLK